MKNWHAQHQQRSTLGERAADSLRNKMGSWAFIGTFLLIMLLWALLNSFFFKSDAWDPYPYILLNLFLSMLAGLQGAILLIAAKRQDNITAAMAQHDYDTNIAAKIEIERLIALSEDQARLMCELKASIRTIPGIV